MSILPSSSSSGEQPIGTRSVTKICVVKRCLVSTIRDDLPFGAKRKLLDYIDHASEAISRMVRRSSIVLLYYIERLMEDEDSMQTLVLPDWDDLPDSYWKSWLRIGLQEFENEMPSADLIPYFEEIKDVVGVTITDHVDVRELLYFDRVLGHAAITFKTSFFNLHNVNFLDKIKRLCKSMAKIHLQGRGAFDLFNSVLDVSKVEDAWPAAIKEFVADVRTRLELKDEDIVHKDADLKLSTASRMRFHWWMQKRFTEMGNKKIMMAPIFDVKRHHIRLDASLLYSLTWSLFKPPKEDHEEMKKPTKKSHPDPELRRQALLHWEEIQQQKAAYKKELEDFNDKNPSHFAATSGGPRDPVTKLNQLLPSLAIGSRPDDISDEEWDKLRAERRRLKDEREKARERERNSDAFKEEAQAYKEYEQRIHSFAMKLFRPFKDKNVKKGWVAAASICTDGVSVSVQYEKTTTYPVFAVDEAERRAKKAKASKKKAKAEKDAIPPKDDYDGYAPTMTDDAVVLGLDPGRTFLATIVFIDENGKRHVWKLSRGQYYVDSGILSENLKKTHRYVHLKSHFATLTSEGGGIRASSSAQVKSYIQQYSMFETQWWIVALKRCESRSSMQRYIGKRKALDSFFARVRKDADELMKKYQKNKVVLAYGAAGINMSATGRGEAAVPTSGTYAAACRAFQGDDSEVSPILEDFTTKVRYATGEAFENVYKRFDLPNGRERFCHTKSSPPCGRAARSASSKYAPRILRRHERMSSTLYSSVEPLQTMSQSPLGLSVVVNALQTMLHTWRDKNKGCLRRGGIVGSVGSFCPETGRYSSATHTQKDKDLTFTMLRGLKYCPVRNIYLARDEESGRAIAGLKVLELQGFGRKKKSMGVQMSPAKVF